MKTVVKILCQEIITRFGIPTVIDSNNGIPFASKVTQLLAKTLAIDWHFNIPYQQEWWKKQTELSKTDLPKIV